jgi:hypothetical protein
MADFTWNPAGVLFDPLTLSASNIKRTGATSFTADIYISWKGKWSNTNFGMKMTTGNKTDVGCPAYDGKYRWSYSTTITGVTYYIGSASSTSATISITLTNYKTDVNPKPKHTQPFYLTITGIPQWWTNVTVGNTTVTDNRDNTLTVTATKGNAGTNNGITAAELEWTYYKPGTEFWYTSNSAGSYITEAFTAAELNDNKKTKTIKIADLEKTNGSAFDTNTTRRFAFKVNTTGSIEGKVNSSWDGKNNTNNVANNSFYINQYIPPQDISAADFWLGYNKNRLTIKEPWTLKWGAATAGNAISPIYGYRVRLFKKSPTDIDFKSIPIIDDNEVQLSIGNVQSDGTVYYHLDIGTDTQYIINPASCNLAAKDFFKFSIQPYTKYGTGALLLGTEVISNTSYHIQNAGIVRIIDANGKGQEGNVWIKISSTEWKEAETVNYKVSDTTWKESQ